MTDHEEDIPVLGYTDALRSDDYRHGYLKCRLVHMQDRSFVMPDVRKRDLGPTFC